MDTPDSHGRHALARPVRNDGAFGTPPGGEVPVDVGAVFRGLVDGLSVHGADFTFAYVSPSFTELSGYDVGELLGRDPFDLGLFHPDDVAGIVQVQAAVLETDAPWRLAYRLRRADGAYVWVESAGRVVSGACGQQFVNVTREAANLESLMQGVTLERGINRELEEFVARQQQFLTTISHRARTPLTSVVGIAELLAHRGSALAGDQQALLLERLQVNAGSLMVLLEDATDADRLTRDDVVLERRVVDLGDLITDVVGDVTADAARVAVEVEPQLRAIVDPAKVRRILHILLGNAFKHAGVGAAVTVEAFATDGGVELVVADDGPGVLEAVREQVFEPFTHGDHEGANPGAGLGLYLVSELAALHRGRAWVDERTGGGARFHVALPRPRPGAPVLGRVEMDQEVPSTSALTPTGERVVTQLLETLHRRVDMDVVYLTMFDDEYQYILATSGDPPVEGITAGQRIPLEETYCVRMIADEVEHVVADTRAHPDLADLPATTDGLACWMGVPVRLPSGQVFGTLCCADAVAQPGLSQAAADELDSFATILGDQMAGDGLLDRGVFDTTDRVIDVLTRPAATHTVLQPIIDLATGAITGVEGLTRFADSDRPVDLWFADAARVGMLGDLEVLTARQVLEQLPHIPDDAYLAVNLSPTTVRSRELAILLEHQPLDRIVLEVTEHAAVADYKPLLTALRPYRERGLRVAIDDVGTGFAGLGHLVQLHPDIIKVDRSIVERLDTEPTRSVAAGALARMADHLDARLVAEGVERPATLAAARELGFTHAQGYLLARPAPTLDLDQVAATARRALV